MSERVCQGCGAPLPHTHPPRKWCSARCRKDQYAQQCIDCGRRIDGTTPSKATGRCHACHCAHVTYWTPERIIEAIREFESEHGRPPVAEEWRCRCQPYPTLHTVQRVFGSWNAAIEAAGFGARGHGDQVIYAARRRARARAA